MTDLEISKALALAIIRELEPLLKSAVLAKLREGVELPEPAIVSQRGTFAYTEAQLLDYGDRRAAASRDQTVKEMQNLIRSVAINECESGVARATAHRCIQVLEAAPKEKQG